MGTTPPNDHLADEHLAWDLPDGADAIDELVVASRRLGSDPSLVLHGGGNTSVKAPWTDITGDVVAAIYVKGSGWDLGSIERAGFAPMPLGRLRALLELDELSDPDMVRELSAARLDPDAPQPSVEALLHAFLPHPAVLHSHADLVLTVTNLRDGPARVRELFGDAVVVVPYVMPGFDLARAVRQAWVEQAHDATIGIVLMAHGLFTFGDTCAEALDRHRALIGRVERFLEALAPDDVAEARQAPHDCAIELADLRRHMCAVAGVPMVTRRHTDPATMRFVARADVQDLATRGPLTPDHVIRTKRIPLVGRDVEGYAAAYRAYFAAHEPRARSDVRMLDAAPRVVLDPELGMVTAGRQPRDTAIAADIYRHTMTVLATTEDRLGGWVPLEAHHLFDVEYWDLEQAKLRRAGSPPPLAGQVAVVTGAASGIGRACADVLMRHGAAVAGIDVADTVADTFSGEAWLGVRADVTDARQQRDALARAVEQFGGVDIAVLSAGIFGRTATVAELDDDEWSRVMAVNVDAAAAGLRELHPFLLRSPVGGRVVVIGSKNVPAPGAGAAAYSASKAALTQLARVAALEWAPDGIRVNVVHPDAVFDTGLWNEELLAERAAKYGLTVEQYERRNLLKTAVTSELVALAVASLVGPAFAATTGAQIPIDGGSDRTL
jgi:rhamnose utilization protein RhaD (predicted bifunctional aldolase and dehydrogenase)/NAD(P)-dependent dehydrogenase (short-subunit alcohol dehydrogenase family)